MLDGHPNGLTLYADTSAGANIATQTYFSVGGGFVVAADDPAPPARAEGSTEVSFGSARELLELAVARGLAISDVMAEFEVGLRPADEVRSYLLHIRDVMVECVPSAASRRTATCPATCGSAVAHTDWFRSA